jgi:hypothetical protein
MLLKVSTVLVQYNGKPIVDNGVEATVRDAVVNAVLVAVPGDKPIQKFQKDELARKIYNVKEEVELTAEEVVMVKERVGECFAPIVVGQVWRLLEGKQ